jgi:putative transposase
MRRPLFNEASIVELALEQLQRAANEQRFSVTAYCFMPDHLHLLVAGTAEDSNGKRFINAFKQYSGHCYSQKWRGTLWQRYGFEHVLRDEEDTMEVVRYILRNPVRAGLSDTIGAYPFVGSLVYDLKDLIDSTSG